MPYKAISRFTAKEAPATTLGDPRTSGGGMNFQELLNELNLRLFQREDADEARRLHFLKLAYTDICTSLSIDTCRGSLEIELDVDQDFYLLPTIVHATPEVAVREPSSVSLTEGRPLELIDLGAYRALPEQVGRVKYYFRQGDVLVLWRIPEEDAQVVSLDFWIKPQVPAADFETYYTILGEEWDEALLLLAKMKALQAFEEVSNAMAAQNDYINFVRRKVSAEARDMEKKPGRSSVPGRASMLTHPRSYRYPRS